jgi:23S rRNA-/tRNA-specific pseudouridylate synthase
MISQQNLEYTRPEVHRNILEFGVYLNSELVYNRLEWVVNGASDIDFSHWPQRNRGDYENVKLVFQNSGIVVLFKPVSVVVESGSGHKMDNLQTWLNTAGKEALGIIGIDEDLYPAHRLDKDTQGLIIFATHDLLSFVQDQFRHRTTFKEYIAKVEGIVNNIYITQHFQARSKTNPLRQEMFMADNTNPKLRNSKTTIYPLYTCHRLDQSIIRVRLYSGRMHQIRLVCEKLGFPLTCDKIYNQNSDTDGFASMHTQTALIPPSDISVTEFEKECERFFGKSEFGLLANHLKFETADGQNIDIEYIPISISPDFPNFKYSKY